MRQRVQMSVWLLLSMLACSASPRSCGGVAPGDINLGIGFGNSAKTHVPPDATVQVTGSVELAPGIPPGSVAVARGTVALNTGTVPSVTCPAALLSPLLSAPVDADGGYVLTLHGSDIELVPDAGAVDGGSPDAAYDARCLQVTYAPEPDGGSSSLIFVDTELNHHLPPLRRWHATPTAHDDGETFTIEWPLPTELNPFRTTATLLVDGTPLWTELLPDGASSWTLPKALFDERKSSVQFQVLTNYDAVVQSPPLALNLVGEAPISRGALCQLNGTWLSPCPLTDGSDVLRSITGPVVIDLHSPQPLKRILLANLRYSPLHVSISVDGKTSKPVAGPVSAPQTSNFADVPLADAPTARYIVLDPGDPKANWFAREVIVR